MASLQDQLMKAGLADARKAKKINKEKRKQAKQTPKGQKADNEAAEAARQAREEKTQRDREINRQRDAQARQRAIEAQIKQLIDVNRIDRGQGDVAYQFADGKQIKKLYVTAKLQDQLTRGQIAIVREGETYQLVPAAVAEKIAQRDAGVVVQQNTRSQETADADDPYADYQIPDDLMW